MGNQGFYLILAETKSFWFVCGHGFLLREVVIKRCERMKIMVYFRGCILGLYSHLHRGMMEKL